METKTIIAIITGVATALGGAGYAGYSKRDSEVEAAYPRCKCKLREMLNYAKSTDWERPAAWCEIAEERDE